MPNSATQSKGEDWRIMSLPAAARLLAGKTLRAGDVRSFHEINVLGPATVPLMAVPASCGFPSPADDYLQRPLDFNELLISNPPATFVVEVTGDSMILAGIFPGDMAVVDRSLTAKDGSVVLAIVENEFTIKRFLRKGSVIVLHPENPAYRDIVITGDMAFEVWGVIKKTIRMRL